MRQLRELRISVCAGMLLVAFPSVPAASADSFGANLSQPANNQITCADGWPNQIPLAIEEGAPLFYNSGNSSCMWTGSGVTQSLAPRAVAR